MYYRILRTICILIITLSALMIFGIISNFYGMTEIVRHDEIYAQGNERFTIISNTELISVSGDYSEFYKISYSDRDQTRDTVFVGTAEIARENSYVYNLTVPIGGECQIYTTYDSLFFSKLTYVDDIISGDSYSDIEVDYLYFYAPESDFSLSSTDERSEDGLVITDPIIMHFGETYTPYNRSGGAIITTPALSKNDTMHFEVYGKNGKITESILTLDSSGNISVLGTDEGYFKLYTERTGGIMVPFAVSYEDSPIIQLVIDSYERMTGVKLEPKDVTANIIASLTELETDTIPSFLTESMFSSMFPNIETLRVNLTDDVEGDMLFYLPNTLKHIEILNGNTNRIEIDASFYGTGSNTKMTLAGAIALNGNGKDPTFSGFESFTLEAGNDSFMGSTSVQIFSQSATLSDNPNAMDVFNNIGKLHIIANHAPLTITAGAGATVYNDIKSGKGGSAIICEELVIENNQTVTVIGGVGGFGFAGTDGNDGYFEVSGLSVSSRYYNGTNGGNGGDGGDAVNVKRINHTGNGTLLLIGGNGGRGGKGGNGGKGADDSQLGFWNNLFHGDGRSGNGANGGNGGNGGYALIVSESLESYSAINITASSGGAAGGRGSAGKSSDRGKDGDSDGSAGEGYSYLVMSGVIIGNEPTVN